MRISTVAACVAAVTATPMPSARQACGGKAPVAEVDLYGKGDYYQKQGCGASGTDGTVLGHLVGCEEDVWYNPSTVGPQGPEKCQTLQQGGVGSWIIRSCRPGCFVSFFVEDNCNDSGTLSNGDDTGVCMIPDPGFNWDFSPFSSWKITCDS